MSSPINAAVFSQHFDLTGHAPSLVLLNLPRGLDFSAGSWGSSLGICGEAGLARGRNRKGQGRVGTAQVSRTAPGLPRHQRLRLAITSAPTGVRSFLPEAQGCLHACPWRICSPGPGSWTGWPRSASPLTLHNWFFGLSLCWSVYLPTNYFFISAF